jgi:hypothetical protein
MDAPRVLVLLDSGPGWSGGILRGFTAMAHQHDWTLLHYHPYYPPPDLSWLAQKFAPAAAVIGPELLGRSMAPLAPAAIVSVAADRSAEGIVSTECFCALYGCPALDALQEQCDPLSAGPVFVEEINCNQLEVQIGQGTGRRYAFDAQTGALVGAEAFAPNAGVLPCDGTRLVMGDPLLDAGSLASYARGNQPPAQLSANCAPPRYCTCGFDPNTDCLSSGPP